MIYGVVLAGGTGKRMGNVALPKQFIELSGVPTIVWTIKRILSVSRFDAVYVAIHPSWTSYLEELIEEHIGDSSRLKLIDGGVERLDSISNAVQAIAQARSIQSDDVIVLHDAVRPFVSERLLEHSIDSALVHDAVVAAIPATDTMLWIEHDGAVDSMPDRSKLFHGQSPDSFKLQVLKDSLETLTEDEKEIITGTAQICMVKGIKIHTVPGDRNNIKLTTPEDLLVAEGLLKEEAAW